MRSAWLPVDANRRGRGWTARVAEQKPIICGRFGAGATGIKPERDTPSRSASSGDRTERTANQIVATANASGGRQGSPASKTCSSLSHHGVWRNSLQPLQSPHPRRTYPTNLDSLRANLRKARSAARRTNGIRPPGQIAMSLGPRHAESAPARWRQLLSVRPATAKPGHGQDRGEGDQPSRRRRHEHAGSSTRQAGAACLGSRALRDRSRRSHGTVPQARRVGRRRFLTDAQAVGELRAQRSAKAFGARTGCG